MSKLIFKKLSLLSLKERSAVDISFSPRGNLLVGLNQGGKSAILKSLYAVLGGKPYRVDDQWKSAEVSTVLRFTVDERDYAVAHARNMFTIFDARGQKIFEGKRITKELGPFLANLLNFHLILADKKKQPTIPPPSFIFAPFYVDQDHGWQRPWSSFEDMRMFTNAAKALSEFHSGLRPNEYYLALAERDRLTGEVDQLKSDCRAVTAATENVRQGTEGQPLALSLEDFGSETESLVTEARTLHGRQVAYRQTLALLTEERQIWHDQVEVIEAGVRELLGEHTLSLALGDHIDCPTCGQSYSNSIAERFELLADTQDLEISKDHAVRRIEQLDTEIATWRANLTSVAESIEHIGSLLAMRQQEVSLGDVIAAKGRLEAMHILRQRTMELNEQIADRNSLVQAANARMRALTDGRRSLEIQKSFSDNVLRNAEYLDVDIDAKSISLRGLSTGRGSAGPRGLAAYYYAFCETVRVFGTSCYAPIVIDEPNQQGQDSEHLPLVMKFLIERAPENSQVIIAAEKAPEGAPDHVIDVSYKKKKVLREDRFDDVLADIEAFLGRDPASSFRDVV